LSLGETEGEVESGFRLKRAVDADGFVVPLEGFFEVFFRASEVGFVVGFCFVLGLAGGRVVFLLGGFFEAFSFMASDVIE
jgi:hypothetical protein